MKSINEAEAQARLDEILKEAQRQPIVIRRHAQDAAVVVSMTQYERLRALDVQVFLALRSEVADEAMSAGLTPERLAGLTRDEE